MSEFLPAHPSSDIEITQLFAFQAMYGHWREYYTAPEGQRLGDEESWQNVLENAARELGFNRDQAREMCSIAQFQAQFPESTQRD